VEFDMFCLKKILITLIFTILGTSTVYAITAPETPKYSDIKKLSNGEMEEQFKEFIGTKDTWRTNLSLLARVKNFIPFQKKTTLDEDRINLSYIHARKNPNSLQQFVLASESSQYPQIKGVVATIRGDKAIVRDIYMQTRTYNLPSLLYFYKTLKAGDTGLETKKFQEYSLAFERLALDIDRAYKNAVSLSLPMVLEFESSALIPESPITRSLFNTIVDDRSHVLKVEFTPDGGRLVSIHPFYAKEVEDNFDLLADQFSKKVKTLRGNLFKDPEAKQRLIDLLTRGQGLSGLLYTDERISELSIQAQEKEKEKEVPEKPSFKKNICAGLFKLFR
jgi:hypothetical protein